MPHITIDCENIDASVETDTGGVEFVGLVKAVVEGYEAFSAELQRLNRRTVSLERRLKSAHHEYRTLASQYAVSKDDPIYSERARFSLDSESGSDGGSGKTHEELVVDAASLFDSYQKHRGLDLENPMAIRLGLEAREKIRKTMGWQADAHVPELSPHGDRSITSDERCEPEAGIANSLLSQRASETDSQSVGSSLSHTSYGSSDPKDPPKAAIDPEVLEWDFTTQGKQGSLKCPFAAMAGMKPSNHPSMSTSQPQNDASQPRPQSLPVHSSPRIEEPLEAKPPAHVDLSTAKAPSATGSASKCPIRFLDQYSPEEVARYFQEHKHEVPRSHEICVKRYQTNTESIKQLDAKYGSLVNMIQGLGAKHQPLLHTRDGDDGEEDNKAMDKVETWVEKVSVSPQFATDDAEDGQRRDNHFDRSLKEVRLGESPSRPWGIQVPLPDDAAHPPACRDAGDASHVSVPVAGSHEHQAADNNRVRSGPAFIPWDHAGLPNVSPGAARDPHKQQPQMIFTGPVFIGYTVEQAAEVLRTSGQRREGDKMG